MTPYTGNPANDPTQVDLIDDSDAPNASNFNVAPEALADSIAYLRERTIQDNATFWNFLQLWGVSAVEPVGGGSPVAPYHVPVWDPIYARWLIEIPDAALNYYEQFISYDGDVWSFFYSSNQNVGSGSVASGYVFGCLVSPVNGKILRAYLNESTVSSLDTSVYNPATNTVVRSIGALASSGLTTGNFTFDGTQLPSLTWTLWMQNANHAPVYSTNDGVSFSSAATWAPPASFLNGVASIITPTFLILFPNGSSVVSKYMTSTDGQNWTPQNMPTLNASEQVVGAAYASFNTTYYMLTSTSTVARLWSSSTGTAGTWSVIYTTTHQATAMACDGRQLMMLAKTGTLANTGTSTLSGTAAYRLFSSLDGGVTWELCPTPNIVPGAQSRLICNGSQFFYFDNTQWTMTKPNGPLTDFTV